MLRECLDDLRLTIDSLASTENDLLTVLGNFRYCLEPRLNSHGIQLEWQVRDLPSLDCLTPQNVLHVLRILQEAFTNILKHAQASKVRVETGTAQSSTQVYVSVSDNGVGLNSEHQGHGLANMRRRAQAIGGSIDIGTATTGTMIGYACLTLDQIIHHRHGHISAPDPLRMGPDRYSLSRLTSACPGALPSAVQSKQNQHPPMMG